MPKDREEPPRYTRYRARKRLFGEREEDLPTPGRSDQRGEGEAAESPRRPAASRRGLGSGVRGGRGRRRFGRDFWRRWATPKRALLALFLLVLGWLALSLILFLLSSHFERTSPPSNVA